MTPDPQTQRTARLLRGRDRLPEVASAGIRLRWITHDEAPAIFSIFSDPCVMRYWGHAPLATLAEAHNYIDSIHAHFRAHDLYQ